MKDNVLIVWIVCASVLDLVFIGGTAYLVFFKDVSGWWFLLTILMTMQPTLFNVLKKRYGLEED